LILRAAWRESRNSSAQSAAGVTADGIGPKTTGLSFALTRMAAEPLLPAPFPLLRRHHQIKCFTG
jgi:hypothetical protein